MEIFAFEVPVVQPTPLNIGPPPVNLTNFHSGVWAVLHTLADDDSLQDDHRAILAEARDALDEYITPDILHDIFKGAAGSYDLDPYNMLVYASDITAINKDAGKIHDAQ
jgi:hypothetical protein